MPFSKNAEIFIKLKKVIEKKILAKKFLFVKKLSKSLIQKTGIKFQNKSEPFKLNGKKSALFLRQIAIKFGKDLERHVMAFLIKDANTLNL